MAEVKQIDGQFLVDMFKEMGIDDWHAVHDVEVSITPPGLIKVSRLLRNENGDFYRDPESETGAPALEFHMATIKWPTDAH